MLQQDVSKCAIGGENLGLLRFRRLRHAPAHPEAAAAPRRQARKSTLEILLVVMVQIAIRHQDLELRIEYQKCLEQILLGPKAKFIQHPIAPELKRKEDVVNMHDHSWV